MFETDLRPLELNFVATAQKDRKLEIVLPKCLAHLSAIQFCSGFRSDRRLKLHFKKLGENITVDLSQPSETVSSEQRLEISL